MTKKKRKNQQSPAASHNVVTKTPFFLRPKPWIIGLSSVAAILLVLVAGICWYYSGEIYAGAFVIDRSPAELDIRVAAIGDGTITLQAAEGDPDLDKPGVFGLRGDNGYGRVHNILSVADGRVVREFHPVDGALNVGDHVRYDRSAFPGDPERAFNLPFDEVTYQSPLGPMRAWFVPGQGDTWAVMVHGRTSSQVETLRALGLVSNLGIPVMSIEFRNDEGAPADPTGRYQFGVTEWEDLHAAVAYALASGAKQVVLMGFSMGGGIVTHFMGQSDLAGNVLGVVLDAPMLNLDDAVDLSGQQRGVPQPIPMFSAYLAGLRYGVDWSALDTRDEFLAIRQPVLVFHGTEDSTIPVYQSDNVVEQADSNVTYIRMQDAEHVGSWNIDPEAYAAVLFKWFSENIL